MHFIFRISLDVYVVQNISKNDTRRWWWSRPPGIQYLYASSPNNMPPQLIICCQNRDDRGSLPKERLYQVRLSEAAPNIISNHTTQNILDRLLLQIWNWIRNCWSSANIEKKTYLTYIKTFVWNVCFTQSSTCYWAVTSVKHFVTCFCLVLAWLFYN